MNTTPRARIKTQTLNPFNIYFIKIVTHRLNIKEVHQKEKLVSVSYQIKDLLKSNKHKRAHRN